MPDEYGSEPADQPQDEEAALALCSGASVQGLVAFGDRAGGRVQRTYAAFPRPGRPRQQVDGFSLHASRPVARDDRAGLERLVRYTARPPVTDERLSQRDDGKIVLQLRRPWADGTTQIVFDPLELMEKLAALVPRPMANLVRYHGYLAPAALWRAEIVPTPAELTAPGPPPMTSPDHDPACQLPPVEHSTGGGRWIPWATLLQRVFGFRVLHCEDCGGLIKLIATVRNQHAVTAILDCLRRESVAPEIAAPVPVPCQLELFGA